jgi:hypothetical protein
MPFIILDRDKSSVIAKFDYIKSNGIQDKSINLSVEETLGAIPVYGNMTAAFIAYPELASYKNRIYENFSRKKLNTIYIDEVNLLVIKIEYIAGPREEKKKNKDTEDEI